MAVKRLNFPNAPAASVDALDRAQLGVGYPFTLSSHVDYCLAAAYPRAASTHGGAPVANPTSAYQVEHCLQNTI